MKVVAVVPYWWFGISKTF